jgi:thioredoxin 1
MSKKAIKKRRSHKPSSNRGWIHEVRGLEEFERRVLESEIPVVVDFWAPWCQPCKLFGPIFEKAAQAHKGVIKFVKVNTQESPDIARAFNIRGIPTTLFFHEGEIANVKVGLMSAPAFESMLQKLLDKAEGRGFFSRLFGKRQPVAEA